MSHPALRILDRLIKERRPRAKRLTEPDLLRDLSAEYAEGWKMCVPTCFNDALDIKQTERVIKRSRDSVTTQGSSFSFKAGDTLYDTPDAYKVWSAALRTLGLCVHVKTASSAGPSEAGTGMSPGSITFAILVPNKDRSKLVEQGEHTMSQDDFVRFLIEGPSEEFKKKFHKFL